MLVPLLSVFAMAQSGALDPDAPQLQVRKPLSCTCPAKPEKGAIVLEGLVVDAEVTLAPDGLSVNDRQTTVFDVTSSPSPEIKGRTRVWHSSDPKKCGVTFDYGKDYKIVVRKLDDGDLETDACLMRKVKSHGYPIDPGPPDQ